MGFDFYFSGASNSVADTFLMMRGANRLCSQLNDRGCIENWCINKSVNSKLFIDSGAYTAYTKQIELSQDDYIDFINSISDKITLFAQLDKIPGSANAPKNRDDILNAPKQSWENFLYMRDRVREPDKLVPIFHQGEDIKWLINMLDWRDSANRPISYIGLAPHLDMNNLVEWFNECWSTIASSSNPNVKVHSFGLTRFDILENYPFSSCDSTSWKLTSAMGSIYTPWGVCYVSNTGTDKKEHLFNQPKQVIQNVTKYIEEMGFTLDNVMARDTYRYCVNIKYILDKMDKFKYKGGGFMVNSQQQLF